MSLCEDHHLLGQQAEQFMKPVQFQQTAIVFFLFFYFFYFLFFVRKQDLTFHANCLQWRQYA